MRKILSLVFALSLFCTPAYPANQWRESTGASSIPGTINPGTLDTNIFQNIVDPADRLLANYREGVTIQYASASTLTVTSGEITVSNSSGSIRLFQRNTGNTSVSWSDIDTGAEATSTTYYVYAVVSSATDSTFTIKISTSSSSPSGITYYKKLGSFYNNSSGDIENIQSSDMTFADYDSGWFSASVNTLYTKSHSLGTVPRYAVVLCQGTLNSGSPNGDSPTYSTISKLYSGAGTAVNWDDSSFYIGFKIWAAVFWNTSLAESYINGSVYFKIL